MTKIKYYITDNVVSGQDKVIGTDVDNNNRTRNYTISDIAGYTIAQIDQITQGNRIDGDVDWTGVGLVFESTVITGTLNGIEINIPQNLSIELSEADPTNDRIDIFVVNENSTLTVIQGTPSSNPQKPNIDETSQYEIGLVLVKAGQTTPDGLNLNMVYDEDTGEPSEWSLTTSTVDVNPGSTVDPYTGTKSIEFKDIDTESSVIFTKTTPVDIANFESLTFKLKKSVSTPRFVMSVILSTASSDVALPLSVFDGQFGFSDAIYDEWQNITINRDDFGLPTFGDFQKITFILSSFDGFIDRVQVNESDSVDFSEVHDLQFVLDNGYFAGNPLPEGKFTSYVNLDIYDNKEFDFNLVDESNSDLISFMRLTTSNFDLFVNDEANDGKSNISINPSTGVELIRNSFDEIIRLRISEPGSIGVPYSDNTFYIPVPTVADKDYYLSTSVDGIDSDEYGNVTLSGKETADIGTVIPLDTVNGHNCNFSAANANTSYTLNDSGIINAWAQVLINTATEPSVVGAVQEGGIEWQASTNLYMVVRNDGDKVVYYFITRDVNTSTYVRTETVGEPSGSDQVLNIVSLTQAEYDAGTPVATTLYIITDA